MDEYDIAIQRLAQAARTLRLVNFKLLQLRHTNDQLSAGLQDLLAQVSHLEKARPVPRGDTSAITATQKGTPTMMALESASAVKATSNSKSFTDAQVVELRVQGGDYAVPINRVQEIVRVPEITRVPHAQAGVEGVINLRGRVLAVVDLASRLALGTTEHARSARVVVVDGGMESIGLLVDGVSEVLRVSATDVEPPSATTTGGGPTSVLGVAKLGERLVLLLDLDAALGGAAIELPTPAQPTQPSGE